MRVRQQHVASTLFGLLAFAFAGIGFFALFVALPVTLPERQSLLERVVSLMPLVLSLSFQSRLSLLSLPAFPVLFALLAVVAWRAPARTWRLPSWPAAIALASTAATVVIHSWALALFAGVATCLAVFNSDG